MACFLSFKNIDLKGVSNLNSIYDLIIIGGGPAGISAGIYAGRSKLNTLIIEKQSSGGQIETTSEIVNYPGIRRSTGSEFMNEMRQQALDFNVAFKEDEVIHVDLDKEVKIIKTKTEELQARSVIIATGASPRKAGFIGESEFTGKGVAYCATCDGEFFQDMNVFVIGGGFAAAEEAMFLTKFATKVTIIVRQSELTCPKSIIDKVKSNPKIDIKYNTELVEAGGKDLLQFARFKNNKTDDIYEYVTNKENESFGIFVFVGYAPQTALFKGKLDMDDSGYIITNENMETNLSGVYAVGDLRKKELKQVVTAVADGAIAATRVEKYVFYEKERLGIKDHIEHQIPNRNSNNNMEKTRNHEPSPKNIENKSSLLNDTLRKQLKDIFGKIEKDVTLVTIVDETIPKSLEFRDLILDISELSNKINVEIYNRSENLEIENKISCDKLPIVALLDSKKEYTGIKFHGVPGGHELNSFILAIYNAAGPGQAIDDTLKQSIKEIHDKVNIKVAVSLSCHLCPDVVVAAQRIALENPLIEAEMINISEFPDLKSKHSIMSVPCIIVNDKKLYFGSKKVDEILELIKA